MVDVGGRIDGWWTDKMRGQTGRSPVVRRCEGRKNGVRPVCPVFAPGQLVVYYRLAGLVPPESRPKK